MGEGAHERQESESGKGAKKTAKMLKQSNNKININSIDAHVGAAFYCFISVLLPNGSYSVAHVYLLIAE